MEVVIATNPLFTRIALEQRLKWANIPVSEFNYSLVAAFEVMHAAKPHPEYYHEILDHLGGKPEEGLMVGDDWERDIAPAYGRSYPRRNGQETSRSHSSAAHV